MKKLSAILIVAMLLALPALQAQTTFGVRGGVNFSNQTIKGGGIELDTKMLTGFNIGVDLEVPVAPDFYFQPGLLFTTKGMKYEIMGDDITTKLNYLEVPLNLLYKPLLGEGNLILAFGPYLAYGIGGKAKSGNETEDIKFGKDEDYKPFDMGGNLSFGYMFSGGFSVQFNTQLGLINIAPEDSGDVTIKNSGFGLSVGYRF